MRPWTRRGVWALDGGVSVNLKARIAEEIARLKAEGLYIRPRVLEAPQEPVTRVEGREVVNLASNNYLGFANHPYLKEKARQYLEKWGAGSGAVRTIAGTFPYHLELEEALARFKGTETALVFQSGFTANQGVLGALLKEGDLVFSDELNHASIIDGLRLTKATRLVFRHADVDHLEELLKAHDTEGLKLIVTDGVFSMDGDIAPLDRIVPLAKKYGAVVYVDDAHGSGVLGERGEGTVHHFGFQKDPDVVQVATLSKAWAVIGGYAAGAHGAQGAPHQQGQAPSLLHHPPPGGGGGPPGRPGAHREGAREDRQALGEHPLLQGRAGPAGLRHPGEPDPHHPGPLRRGPPGL
jgi:glycine C-acetyltransferase